MKQLNFLKNLQNKDFSCKEGEFNYWKLFIDGASRNNPGPAGAGIFLLKNDELVVKKGFSLGLKTNNQAEYLALLIGIFYLKKNMCKEDIAIIISDSQLLVRQMLGEYKVKNPDLRSLFRLSNQLLSGINYNIAHVLRYENKDADKMANVGIDKGKKLPKDFIDVLHDNEIQI